RLDGGQAEYVRVPHADRCLLALPDEVDEETAIFLADILPTGYGSVTRGEVGVGDLVVVVGCGPVGLMAVLCAAKVAGTLIAVDGVAARRALATRLGAHAVAPDEAEATVADASGGLGADVLAVAAIAATVLATRSSDGASTVRTASPATVRSALITRLEASHLTYRWVVCVRTGRVFRQQAVVRCNVNFGDPHIEAYCS